MLAQSGGPQPFWIFCALVVVPLLVLSLVFVKSCPTGRAAIAGLLFSVPILGICVVLPFEAEVVSRSFRFEIWCDGVVVVVVSIALSVLVSRVFHHNHAELGAAPNSGPSTPSESSGANGPQSVT
jgi:hypothetical protein